MEEIKALLELDFSALLISIITVMLGLKALSGIWEWFIEKTGLESKWKRQRRIDHELLIKTSESLDRLQSKHQEDVNESNEHDRKIEEDLTSFMADIKKSISDTQSELLIFAQNRVKDREQSIKIQEELIDFQNGLADSQKNISNTIGIILNTIKEMKQNTDTRFAENEKRLAENEQKEYARLRAELKDKIGESYRYYHEKGKINDMEFEALEDLIKAYEDCLGTNSFVHSIVLKEMYTWERI